MKLPPQAQRVFKGIIFDVYQWEQKMFDGSVETFEMLKRPNTTQIIATQNDKILLSMEEQPNKPKFTSFLGGRQELGETPLEAAKRELLEEAGLVSDDWELWKAYEPVSKIEWTIQFFIARNCRKIAEQTLDAGEKIQVITVDFESFVSEVLSDRFWGKEFGYDLLKIKNEGKLSEFKKKLFGVKKSEKKEKIIYST